MTRFGSKFNFRKSIFALLGIQLYIVFGVGVGFGLGDDLVHGGTGDDIDRPQRLVDRARIFTHVLSDSDEKHCQLRICGSGEAS